jgi:homoserine dehydrogenase
VPHLPSPSGHSRLCVLKFGSSVLRGPDDYSRAVHEIYRHVRKGEKVVAVVSAMDGETDALFDLGARIGNGACDTHLARLVRCGELKSAALMGLALKRAGLSASALDPHEIGLIAEGAPLDGNLGSLDIDCVHDRLDDVDVVVAPGFFGESADGPVTLGRGGTDLTAVVLADWLGASRVRLIKDVDGVYSDDPRDNPQAERLDALDYAEAVKVSRGLVQEKAILEAQARAVIIEVAALGRGYETRIAPGSRRRGSRRTVRRLRVSVLGHGSVGAGVCDHLLAHPSRFELNPVLVRDPEAHGRANGANRAFTREPAVALRGTPDIVVEVMGGTEIAHTLSDSVLRSGAHLVSANKAVIAKNLQQLQALADGQNCMLRYSAAVGGGVPALETVDRQTSKTGILSIESVVNGTCNFVLGRLGDGVQLTEAIAEAQSAGFAEADPSADINGDDAAEKLSILIHHAFGLTLPPHQISKTPLSSLSASDIAAAIENNQRIKQIARCTISPDGQVEASITLEALPPGHPLADLRNEGNGFLISQPHNLITLRGKGAGRWPTAEAVFADIMEIQRQITQGPDQGSRQAMNPPIESAARPEEHPS